MDYSFINTSVYFKLNSVTFILMGLKLKASSVETSDFLLIIITTINFTIINIIQCVVNGV